MRFLYMGFSQRTSIRCYRFQGVVPRERPTQNSKNLEFLLSTDMSLLAQYRIRIQDLPTLCLQILTAALAGTEDNATRFASYSITREDLSAFACARNAIEDAKAARRKSRFPFKPSASSQLRWPQAR
jgi:hypothetical protein